MMYVGQRSKRFLVAIAKKIPQLLHTQWIILMNFTFLANFIHKTPRQTFISGTSGIIQCSALGNPAPQFKWSRKDGQSIQGEKFIQLTNGSLKVEEMHREHNGTYICTIQQSRGTESTSEKFQKINVRVLGKMKKKINLDVLNDQ